MTVLLVVGAKGGVGTTTVAQEVIRTGKALAVDTAGGSLAASLERATWHLTRDLYAATGMWRATLIEKVLQKRITLLWTAEHAASADAGAPWELVRDLARRGPVVIDGGIEPPAALDSLITQVVIVTQADNSLAQWHVARLQQRFPAALVSTGTRQAARELAGQLIKGVQISS